MRVNPFASVFAEIGQFFRRSNTDKNQALRDFSIPEIKEDRVTLSDKAIQKLSDIDTDNVKLRKITTSSYYFIERKVPKVELLDGAASAFNVHNSLEFLRLNKTKIPNVENLSLKPSFIDKQIKSFQKINQKVLSLRKSLEILKIRESLNIKSAKSSDPDVLSATTSTKSPAGIFQIKISQLAGAGRLVSNQVTDPFSSQGFSGTVKINGFDIKIDESDSLEDIKNKINFGEDSNKNGLLDLGEDINKNGKLEILTVASTPFSKGIVILEDLNGDNIIQGSEDLNNNELLDGGILNLQVIATISDKRLFLNSISQKNKNIGLQDDNNILLSLGFFELDRSGKPVLKEQQLDPDTFENLNIPPVSSSLSVNGFSFTNEANDISNIIQETTLHLKATSSKDISLTISTDIKTALKHIKNFVNVFNDVFKFLNNELAFGRILERDITVQKLRNGLKDRAIDDVLNTNKEFNNLNKIGITSHNQSKNQFNQLAIKNLVTRARNDSQPLALPPKGSNSIFAGLDKIGIKTKEDDTLRVEEKKLKKVLKNNIEEVIRLFTDTSSGIIEKLNALIDVLAKPLSGTISMKVDNKNLLINNTSFASELVNNKTTLLAVQSQSLQEKVINSIEE